MEMFRLSPEVVKPGLRFRDLIAHRKDTGSFRGDIDEFCSTVMRNVKNKKTTINIMETADGRSIQVVNKPLANGGWVATQEDITDRTRVEREIAHLAHFDALTDLPNSVSFRDRLKIELLKVKRGERLALLYIDIDEFKSVNDSLGHLVGDEFLQNVAVRLRRCVREVDMVARLGGDEFAIIQTGIAQRADVIELVKRIHDAVREPCHCSGHQIMSDASIGIALAPGDGTDLTELLKNADLAMYGAKANGRRTHRFFEPEMDVRIKTRRALELDLRRAVDEGSFELHYQPVVDLKSDQIVGFEALLRWNHPQRGIIPPDQFIPIAEETGLICQIGDWVLATACAEAINWPSHIKIAVNVSPVQLVTQSFSLSRAMENCPLSVTRNCPLLG
jgi:diguanylate cyclase (GGDEF)-like protein